MFGPETQHFVQPNEKKSSYLSSKSTIFHITLELSNVWNEEIIIHCTTILSIFTANQQRDFQCISPTTQGYVLVSKLAKKCKFLKNSVSTVLFTGFPKFFLPKTSTYSTSRREKTAIYCAKLNRISRRIYLLCNYKTNNKQKLEQRIRDCWLMIIKAWELLLCWPHFRNLRRDAPSSILWAVCNKPAWSKSVKSCVTDPDAVGSEIIWLHGSGSEIINYGS